MISMPNMSTSTRDGRTLYVEQHGDGTPVVVFESGNGASRASWGAVVERVAPHARCVVYDRSGLGRSPADPGRRDLSRLAADLVDVLDSIGEGPFVLVGHSWGGPIVRTAAAAVPDRIAGLVLVDQTDEGCPLFFEPAAESQVRIGRRLLPVLARLGIIRLMIRPLVKALPEPWATAMRTEDGTPAAIRAQIAELEHHVEDMERLRDHPVELPDVPVSIVSGGKAGFLERGRRPEVVDAHRRRADALPQGRHVVAERSSHYVPLTEPDVVAAEILRILDAQPSGTP